MSDELKQAGNAHLKEARYAEAEAAYTQALALDPSNPVLFSNRAQAQIKMENYGLALADAEAAIAADPAYAKGYFRRAVAHTALLQYKPAIADLKQVLALTSDAASKRMLVEVQKLQRLHAFMLAIRLDDAPSVIDSVDFADMACEWLGPALDISQDKLGVEVNMTEEYIAHMVDMFKSGQNLPKKHAYAIVAAANTAYKKAPALVEINRDDVIICGDTHGQFFDVCNIFAKFGEAKNLVYLFNGDFVDRGSWLCEVLLLLYALKLAYPDRVHLNRGNHETDDMNEAYGFKDEATHKYLAKWFTMCSESFGALPYATLVNDAYLVMHGGLFSRDTVTLDDIRKIDRFKHKQPPKEGIEMELLWTDPHPGVGRVPSKRGLGIQFGKDITERFCKTNNLKGIIRSHEVRMGGYEVEHDGYLVTVFSAPNYCDQSGNLGAVVKVHGAELAFETFEAVPHPDKPPMAYSKRLGF